MLQVPFYDPEKSYEEIFEQGPFGVFAQQRVFSDKVEPCFVFLVSNKFAFWYSGWTALKWEIRARRH